MTANTVTIPYKHHEHEAGQRTEYNISTLLPAPWATREFFVGILGNPARKRYTVISSPSEIQITSNLIPRRRLLLVRHSDKSDNLVNIAADEVCDLIKIVAEISDSGGGC